MRFRGVEICRLILSLGPFGHFVWHTPNLQWLEEKREWTRCFFDDGVYVSQSDESIKAKSVNERGLRQVHYSINEMGVGAKMYGPYSQGNPEWSPYYMLVIPRKSLVAYDHLIGFNHPAKEKSLRKLISTRNQGSYRSRRSLGLPRQSKTSTRSYEIHRGQSVQSGMLEHR